MEPEDEEDEDEGSPRHRATAGESITGGGSRLPRLPSLGRGPSLSHTYYIYCHFTLRYIYIFVYIFIYDSIFCLFSMKELLGKYNTKFDTRNKVWLRSPPVTGFFFPFAFFFFFFF